MRAILVLLLSTLACASIRIPPGKVLVTYVRCQPPLHRGYVSYAETTKDGTFILLPNNTSIYYSPSVACEITVRELDTSRNIEILAPQVGN